jgi:tryptophanyl-tRNA synthetase
MKRSLSGIKSTGLPHLGNYLGMIKPAIELQGSHEAFYFIANLHALTSVRDGARNRQDTNDIAAVFLAAGFDPSRGALFRQSDVPEVTELTWYLSCVCPMGDLFRAHAYKSALDKGEEGALNHGVFTYPVLMAADILIYDSDVVPVGKDQLQHLEMAREIVRRFNYYFGENSLKEPKAFVREEVAVVPGIDGRKMSKSYGNGIDPFLSAKEVKKQVMAIVTDSKGLEDKKDPDTCNIVALYRLFATPAELAEMQSKYRAGGYGYGHAKLALLDKIEGHFTPMRTRYNELKANPSEIEMVLEAGAQKARKQALVVLERVRKACGVSKTP